MINFIDTNLYEDGVTISVIVYSDDRDRAVNKIKDLISGEKVIEERKNHSEYSVIVEKGNIKIKLTRLPLSTLSRGHRCQYSIVDREIIGHGYGTEIFFASILTSTFVHSHLIKEETNVKEIMSIMLF